MMYVRNNSARKWHLPIPPTIAVLGVVLLVVITFFTVRIELAATSELMYNSIGTLKQQCVSFNRLVVSDRTKSLFRLSDNMLELSRHLRDDPQLINDEYLSEFIDYLPVSGVALLDGNMNIVASAYSDDFDGYNWRGSVTVEWIDGIADTRKVYCERFEIGGQFYDVCGVSRLDSYGVLVGFYHQPTGLLSDTENDISTLMNGLRLERSGAYIVAKNGIALAASDTLMKGETPQTSELLRRLENIESGGGMHTLGYNEKLFFASHSVCEGYELYVFFPIWGSLGATLTVAAVFSALYIAFCMMLFFLRNRALAAGKLELEKSNRRLRESMGILHSLENIYFTIFYVDIKNDTYSSVVLASWLDRFIPETGVYTELKDTLMNNMMKEEYRQEVDSRMRIDFIREALKKENISVLHHGYYTDYEAVRGDSTNWVRVSVTVVDFDEDGYPFHVLVMLQDVNNDKAREAEYQAQIIAEAHEAKLANMAKSEFLRRISHDIRTPINGIKGYLNMAERYPDNMELQAKCRSKASAALSSLLALVNNVLDMSRLESSNIELDHKPFDLAQLVDEVDSVIEAQAEEHGIHYESAKLDEMPTKLVGSSLHLRQILLNLLGNAVKYGRTGGSIKLEIRLISQENGKTTYEFTCRDDGIGMSKEFQQHLFEPFSQEADDARTKYKGTGLGLSIVKKIVDVMGGTITFNSRKNVGTTFYVTLTFDTDTVVHEAAAAQATAERSLTGKRILLVEDNELNMEIADFMLSEHGAEVTKAWNGREAAEAFSASEAGHFDIILMDIMMPVMNGIEAAEKIRAMERPDAKTVPIAAMSANAFSDDVQKCLDAGMNGHIAKPVDEGRLISLILKMTSNS